MGFEPTRAEHIGLAVQRLNHSATSSVDTLWVDVVRSFLSYLFVKKILLSRRVEYVVDGSIEY